MKPKSNEIFQKFVSDQNFIDWVRYPTSASDKYWKTFRQKNPSLQNEFDYARYIIKRLHIKNEEIDDEIRIEVWNEIQKSLDISTKKKRFGYRWPVAAAIIVLIGIGVALLTIKNQKSDIDYNSIAAIEPEGGEIKLILSDNTSKVINSKEPSFDYSKNGQVLIDSTTVIHEIEKAKTKDEEKFNQIVVPKGRRSSLILADGTKVFLNSGSLAIYPIIFSAKKREVYIQGEAYFRVSHDPDRPFYVITDHIKVRVLGTEFNVKSYGDETCTSVVLVKGSVKAIAETGNVSMKENELLTVSNKTGETKLEKTDVLHYISWKDGWLYCSSESISSITKKLSRYYDVNIRLKDDNVGKVKITGKLDLKGKCTEVLDIISFTAPVKYEVSDDEITLSIQYK
jgi:transmembrane sensor